MGTPVNNWSAQSDCFFNDCNQSIAWPPLTGLWQVVARWQSGKNRQQAGVNWLVSVAANLADFLKTAVRQTTWSFCLFLHQWHLWYIRACCSCALWTGRPGHFQWADFRQLGGSNLGSENNVSRVEISVWDAVADSLWCTPEFLKHQTSQRI